MHHPHPWACMWLPRNPVQPLGKTPKRNAPACFVRARTSPEIAVLGLSPESWLIHPGERGCLPVPGFSKITSSSHSRNFTPLSLTGDLPQDSLLLSFGHLNPVWMPHQVWGCFVTGWSISGNSPHRKDSICCVRHPTVHLTLISLTRENNPVKQVVFSTVYSLETKAQRVLSKATQWKSQNICLPKATQWKSQNLTKLMCKLMPVSVYFPVPCNRRAWGLLVFIPTTQYTKDFINSIP